MIEDLAKLNETQLAVLRDAIVSELRNSPEIRSILKRKLSAKLRPSMELRTSDD
jgi:hypothetical protein